MNSIFTEPVLNLLRANERPQEVRVIAASLDVSMNTLYPVLRDLVERKAIVKFSNGFYQANENFNTVGKEVARRVKAAKKKKKEEKKAEFGLSVIEKPEHQEAQKHKNKQMKEFVDNCPTKKKTKKLNNEEKVMPENITKEGDLKKGALLESIEQELSKLNMPIVNIPKLDEADLKMSILDQLAAGVDNEELSSQLGELRIWCADVLATQWVSKLEKP